MLRKQHNRRKTKGREKMVKSAFKEGAEYEVPQAGGKFKANTSYTFRLDDITVRNKVVAWNDNIERELIGLEFSELSEAQQLDVMNAPMDLNDFGKEKARWFDEIGFSFTELESGQKFDYCHVWTKDGVSKNIYNKANAFMFYEGKPNRLFIEFVERTTGKVLEPGEKFNLGKLFTAGMKLSGMLKKNAKTNFFEVDLSTFGPEGVVSTKATTETVQETTSKMSPAAEKFMGLLKSKSSEINGQPVGIITTKLNEWKTDLARINLSDWSTAFKTWQEVKAVVAPDGKTIQIA